MEHLNVKPKTISFLEENKRFDLHQNGRQCLESIDLIVDINLDYVKNI